MRIHFWTAPRGLVANNVLRILLGIVALGALWSCEVPTAESPGDKVKDGTSDELLLPVVPTGVAAAAADGQITVTWDEVEGATGYCLYWTDKSDASMDDVTEVDDAVSPYVLTGLTNGTAYSFVVTAKNEAGEGSPSSVVTATPQVAIASAPQDLAASASDAATSITWKAVTGADTYNLYWSTKADLTTATGTKIEKVTTPYAHKELTNGTTYYYLLTAVNAGGESAASAQASATPQVAATGAPTDLAASSGDTTATVSWKAVTGADSYNLYWSTTTGVTTATGTKIEKVTSPYTHKERTNGTAYYYIATAVNGGGESPASAQAGTTPQVSLASAPTDVAAARGDTAISVSWTKVSGATSYNLYWSTTAGVTTATGTKIEKVTSPYSHTQLTNGTTYYYIVTAVNAGGESSASSQASVSPQIPAPSAPTGLSGTAGHAAASLSWTSVAAATSYNLYWSTTTGVTTGTGTKITGVTSPFGHTGLTNGTTYYYVVTAVNVGGESSASTQLSLTPAAPVLTATFTSITDETITLSGSQSISKGTNLSVSMSETFDEYQWYLDGTLLTGQTGATLTYSTAGVAYGQHNLTAFVKKNGGWYSKTLYFTVKA